MQSSWVTRDSIKGHFFFKEGLDACLKPIQKGTPSYDYPRTDAFSLLFASTE